MKACPFETPDCKYFNNPNGCHTSVHHTQYPRRDYKTPVEKRFRELPENKEELCRAEHDELHFTTEPPIKPSLEVMRHAVNDAKVRRLVSEYEEGAA